MTDNALADWQQNANLPHPPTEFTLAFRQAVNGEGPLLYQWQDKPHRLVFDLCSHIEKCATDEHPNATDWQNRAERAEQALAERDAEIARLREEISILKNRRYTNAADELERARKALGGTDAE